MFFSIFQNFRLSKENLASLQTYLYLNSVQKPSFIILTGNFFDLRVISSELENEEYLACVQSFWLFLNTNKIYFENVRLLLVPDRTDLGLHTFPKQEIHRKYLGKIVEDFSFVSLTENPLRFQYMGKVCVLSKVDQINTILRQTTLPLDQTKETIELLSNTINYQQQLSPYLDNQLNKIYIPNSPCSLQSNEDYVIICDNFVPFGVFQSGTQ